MKYIIEVYNYSVFYELCCANIADTILSSKSHTFSNSLLIDIFFNQQQYLEKILLDTALLSLFILKF